MPENQDQQPNLAPEVKQLLKELLAFEAQADFEQQLENPVNQKWYHQARRQVEEELAYLQHEQATEPETMTLNREQSRQFAADLLDPPPPNQALKNLLQRQDREDE